MIELNNLMEKFGLATSCISTLEILFLLFKNFNALYVDCCLLEPPAINWIFFNFRDLTRFPEILQRLNTSLRCSYCCLTSLSSLKHVSSLLLAVHTLVMFNLILVGNVHLLIMALFIDLHNMMLSLLHENLPDV